MRLELAYLNCSYYWNDVKNYNPKLMEGTGVYSSSSDGTIVEGNTISGGQTGNGRVAGG